MGHTLGILSKCRAGYFVLGGFLSLQTLTSWANPTGGQIVSGTASINTLPGTVTINQATSTAIINWQDFSIASGELTRFQVPTSSSATLNRVTGGNISTIYGTLQSNGQLYLINPNGIVVGASGKIDTAGFIATTLNFSDAQFNAQGDLNFSGSSDASVNNQGTIQASTGDVYLIATQVNNSGTINAPQGNVGLAAGTQVLLQKAGDQHLFVQADANAKPQATGVSNTGAIRSAAAELRAAGGNAYALAINNSGNIAATGITKINGQVYLTADGGNISNSGQISAKNANGNGGTIVVNGSGTSSTGNTVLNSGTLDASATVAGGNGGSVTLKNSNGTAIHSGKIIAQGGQDGIGGNAEISGAKVGFTGTVDLTAPGGVTGDFLFDPATLNVITGGTGTVVSGQNDAVSTTIDPTTVEGALATANLILNADTNITVTNGITWASNTTLTLSTNAAGGTVNINAPISGYSLQVNSPNINVSGTTLTTTQTGIPYNLTGLVLGDFSSGSTGVIDITNSTITGSSMQIGVYNGSTNVPNSQVNINNSAIHLVLGSNPPTSSLFLQIAGQSATPGAPGVNITNGSVITADNGGQVQITGTGLLAAGSDATGVLISGSTLSYGTPTYSGTDVMDIQGYSDAGFTALTPNATFANNSYGVQVINSTISSYSTDKMTIKGTAYAANNLDSVGVDLSANSVIETFNGTNHIKGSVLPETFASASGEANLVAGVQTMLTQIEANGATASINIDTDTHNTTATDNGITSVDVRNVGAYFLDGTSITASGSNLILSAPIVISGRSGPAQASSGNFSETDSLGVWVYGGTTGATVTNSGLGATTIFGEAGSATGPNVIDLGVGMGGSAQPPDSITSPGGGSIGIAGLGGMLGVGTNGLAAGIGMEYSSVTTTTGDILILAAAGSASGAVPPGTLVGLSLQSATLQTGMSGGTTIPGGGTVPPLIMVYATDSTAVKDPITQKVVFQLGSPTDYAIKEDSTSKLVTGNLVMGNYYDLLTAYAPASDIAKLPTFAAFNTFITTGTLASTISSEGIIFNPAGIIDLSSPLNQITNLDSALVGSGGFNLYDSVSLVVDPIGSSDNMNYGQIDMPALGPVTIQTAPGQSLTLTDVSPITGLASSLPVIATSGTGNDITLITGNVFTNQDVSGVPTLSVANGARYIIYSNDVSADNVGNLLTLTSFTPLFNTPYTGTPPAMPGNLIVYSGPSGIIMGGGGGGGGSGGGSSGGSPGDPMDPLKPVQVTLNTAQPISPVGEIPNPEIIGGASGVAGNEDQKTDHAIGKKLAQKYGQTRAELMLEIIKNDLKDGSTVNTDTLTEKWVANTGLSKLVTVNGNAELFDGLALPMGDASLIFDQSQTGATLDELSHTVFGHAPGQTH